MFGHHYHVTEAILRERAKLPTYNESIEVTPYISVALTKEEVRERKEREIRRTKRLAEQNARVSPPPASPNKRPASTSTRGGTSRSSRGPASSAQAILPRVGTSSGSGKQQSIGASSKLTHVGSIARIVSGTVEQGNRNTAVGIVTHCYHCDRACPHPDDEGSSLPSSAQAPGKPFCSKNCVFLYESSQVPCYQCNKKCTKGVIPVKLPAQKAPASFCSQACMIARINYAKAHGMQPSGKNVQDEITRKRDRDRISFGHRINGHGGDGAYETGPDVKTLNPRVPAMSLLAQTWHHSIKTKSRGRKEGDTESARTPHTPKTPRSRATTVARRSVRVASRADTVPSRMKQHHGGGGGGGDVEMVEQQEGVTSGLKSLTRDEPSRHGQKSSRTSFVSTEPDTPLPTPPPLRDVDTPFAKVQHYPFAAPFSENLIKRSLRAAPSRESFSRTADPTPYLDALKAAHNTRAFNPDNTQQVDVSKIKIKPFRRTLIGTSYNANKLDGYGTFTIPTTNGPKNKKTQPRRASATWTPSDPYASIDHTHHRRRDGFTEYVNLTTMERNNAKRFLDAKGARPVGMYHDRGFR